jgi:Ca-activated chloride channel homolog
MKTVVLMAIFLFVLGFAPKVALSQSGRKAPAENKNNPTKQSSPDSEQAELENQPVSNGSVPGNGEIIEGDTLHVNTALVSVPVGVMDRSGKYVPNLQRRDFHVFDNGVEQRIAYFATVDQPFTVVLLIDTSGSTHFRIEEMQDAAISFVNQLKDADRVMVMSFDDQIKTLSEPTNNRDDLIRAIRRTRTGGGTRLYDAVDVVIKQKLSQISGRKAIVLFTDGVDTTSRHASYSSTILEAQESDGAVYSVAYDTSDNIPFGSGGRFPGGRGGIILNFPFPGSGGGRGGRGGGGRGGGGPRGSGSTPGDYRRADEYLHEVAQESGGRYYRGDTLGDISAAFSEVADELRRQYSIGYYPTPVGQPGQRREIKVRVGQPGLVVKARDSYVYSQTSTSDKAGNNQQPGSISPQDKHLNGSP